VAEVVDTPPITRSWVGILGKMVPRFCSKGDPPLLTERTPDPFPRFRFPEESMTVVLPTLRTASQPVPI